MTNNMTADGELQRSVNCNIAVLEGVHLSHMASVKKDERPSHLRDIYAPQVGHSTLTPHIMVEGLGVASWHYARTYRVLCETSSPERENILLITKLSSL